jgi:cell volume regulation protein A
VGDLFPFAIVTLFAGLALLAAVASNGLAERIRVPAPALFLVLAALASDLVPRLGDLSIRVDQRIVTVALVYILFDGGMHIGWRRLRPNAGAVLWLGIAGTAVTAAAVAAGAHWLFGFGWRPSLLLGAALAPTDPAVVFSVLGRREIGGRTGVLLEAESGANDPVGIALMVSLLGATGTGWSAFGSGIGSFALEMVVGAAVGAVGGWLMIRAMRRLPLPSEALYPLEAAAFALLLYGGATALHGSGFLAVFLAGIMLGDARVPFKDEVERFAGALSSLAEIVAFIVLGLSIHLTSIFRGGLLWTALGLAALLMLVVRPLLVGLLLLPVDLRVRERTFVVLAGLKGAVPILLGTYVLSEGVPDARQIYDIVFVIVFVSVVVQGGLVPTLARVLRVPMRLREPAP